MTINGEVLRYHRTRAVQHLFKELSHPSVGDRRCKLYHLVVSPESNCFEHASTHHPTLIGNFSSDEIVTIPTDSDISSDTMLSVVGKISDCSALWF